MARGWESKSIESQIEEAAGRKEQARRISELDAERDSLMLTRKRVVHDLEAATHPRYRAQLEAALAHLDAQIARLGPAEH
jgi:hypothetical protein